MSAAGTPSEPVVLVPGMNCSAALWAPVRERLTATGVHQVILPVLAGPTIEADVAAVLAGAPSRFALAGLSLGGIVAMALVRAAPERVTRLALLDTSARPPTPAQQAGWAAARAQLAAGVSARQVQADALEMLLSPGARRGLDRAVLAMADEVGGERLDGQLAAQQGRVDQRAGLGLVRVPTVVMAGGADAMCSLAVHEEIAAAIPGSTLTVLPGIGHLSCLEAPDLVARHLTSWLPAQP